MKRLKQPINNSSKLGLIFCLLFSALFSAYVLNVYSQNQGLLGIRSDSLQRMSDTDLIKSYHWIRHNTAEEDVILCSNKYSMRVVAPAGRKVIATHACFSNPYVDFSERNQDRNRMFDFLKSGEVSLFAVLCKKYEAKYIITAIPQFKRVHKAFERVLNRVFTRDGIVIMKIQLDNKYFTRKINFRRK